MAGRKTLGFVYGGVTREARVRISATVGGSTLTGCSTDGFAIRPAALSAPVATDADWMTAGTTRTLNNASDMGGAVHRAGRPFRLSTSALDAAGAVTSGYTNVPVLQFAGCVLPAACISADITSVTASLATSAGVAATNAASFSEVGSFSARAEDLAFAAIDTSDGSTLAERMITSAASTIGRFVPDAFLLEATNTPEFAPGQGTACTGSAASQLHLGGAALPLGGCARRAHHRAQFGRCHRAAVHRHVEQARSIRRAARLEQQCTFCGGAGGDRADARPDRCGRRRHERCPRLRGKFRVRPPQHTRVAVQRRGRTDRHVGGRQRVGCGRQRHARSGCTTRDQRWRRRHRVHRRQRQRGQPGRLRPAADHQCLWRQPGAIC
jgi:hypothetical protein